jgi:hypothetical protein
MKMTLDRGPSPMLPNAGLSAGQATCYSALVMSDPDEPLGPARGASTRALVVVRPPDMLAPRFDWAAAPSSPR